LIPDIDEIVFHVPNWLWLILSLISGDYLGTIFPSLQLPVLEFDKSPLSRTDINAVQSLTFTPM
jgi:hypothetical protein